MRFSASSHNSISQKSIFGQIEVIFLNVYFFPGRGCLIPVSTFNEECFDEKKSSLAGLKKKFPNFPEKYRFWPFLTDEVHVRSQFAQRRGKILKNPWNIC